MVISKFFLLGITFLNILFFWGCRVKEKSEHTSLINQVVVDGYYGKYKDNAKNGEWLEYKNNAIIRRDYYKRGVVILSIEYSKDGEDLILCQTFIGDQPFKQIVFDSAKFKTEYFDLESGISNIEKGKKIYSYYCKSCHSKEFSDVRLNIRNDSLDVFLYKINSINHPIIFTDLDSIEVVLIREYILNVKK